MCGSQQQLHQQLYAEQQDVASAHGAEERTCAVCFTKPVGTIALPCRHSILCEDCMGRVRATTGRCPICRAHIDLSVLGTFAGEFVDLAPDVLAAVAAPLARAQAAVYERMYDHIRVFLVLGAGAAAGSAVCFLLPATPLLAAAVPLATGAFAVGYLPWLAVSIAAFESDDGSGGLARPQLFTAEGRRRPALLVVKGTMLLVAAPVAITVFFAPYLLYAGAVRPCFCHVVPFFLRVALRCLIHVSCYTYMYALRPVGSATWWTAHCICIAVGKACECARWCCGAAAAGVRYVAWDHGLVPLGKTAYAVGSAFYTRVLVPAARATANGATALGRCCTALARALYEYVLSPCGCGIARGAALIFAHFIRPLGRAAVACLTAAGRAASACASAAAGCLARAAGAVYVYVLRPTGGALAYVACKVVGGLATVAGACARGLAGAATAVFVYVLRPTGSAVARGLAAAAHGLAAAACAFARVIAGAASAVFTYVLAPAGRASAYVASKMASGVAAVARAVYGYALVPIGSAVFACCRGLGTAITACGRALWRAAAAVAAAVHGYILAPAGRALVACATAARDGLIVPLASGIAGMCRSLAAGMRSFGGWAAAVARQAAGTVSDAVRGVRQAFRGSP